jgi:hypothetical protein
VKRREEHTLVSRPDRIRRKECRAGGAAVAGAGGGDKDPGKRLLGARKSCQAFFSEEAAAELSTGELEDDTTTHTPTNQASWLCLPGSIIAAPARGQAAGGKAKAKERERGGGGGEGTGRGKERDDDTMTGQTKRATATASTWASPFPVSCQRWAPLVWWGWGGGGAACCMPQIRC